MVEEITLTREQVEKVARANCQAYFPTHNIDDYQTDERRLWQWFEEAARAAIRALSEARLLKQPVTPDPVYDPSNDAHEFEVAILLIKQMREALEELKRCSRAIVGITAYDDESQEAWDMFEVAQKKTREALAAVNKFLEDRG